MKNIYFLVLSLVIMSCSSDDGGDKIYSTPCDECPIIVSVDGPYDSFNAETQIGYLQYNVVIENCDGSDEDIVIINDWDGTYDGVNPIDNNPPVVNSEYCN